jgi:hypothetical protein
MQTLQGDYFPAYRHLKLSRDAKGVLVAEFHNDGGPYIMNAQGHTEFVDAFNRIGQDRANKIVIMTGAGGNFIGDVEWSSFGDVTDPGVWSRIHDELGVLALADRGLIFFVLIPGYMPLWPGLAGPLLWVLGWILTTLAYFRVARSGGTIAAARRGL